MSLVKKPVGPGRYGDGIVEQPRLSDEGAGVVGEYCGKYYELCARGNLFIYTSAIGGIQLTTVAATNSFTIWNPAGSGKNFVPLVGRIGYVSGAAAIAGFIGYYRYPNAGANIGLPFSVFTDIVPVCACLGNDRKVATMRLSTANTLPAAPTYIRAANFSMLQARAVNVNAPYEMVEDLNGEIIVTPGTTFSLAGNAALLFTAAISVIGAEIPIPLVA